MFGLFGIKKCLPLLGHEFSQLQEKKNVCGACIELVYFSINKYGKPSRLLIGDLSLAAHDSQTCLGN